MNVVTIARVLGAGSLALVLLTARESRADDAAAADTPAPAAAPERRPFGAEGTVVLDDVLGFGLTSGYAVVGGPLGAVGTPVMSGWLSFNDSKQEIAGRSQRVTTFGVTPSVDVFVAPRLSLGSQLGAFRSTVRSETESTFTGAAVKPRIGYVLPIGNDLAFWLRGFGTFTVAHVTNESSPPMGGTATGSAQTTLGWGLGAEGALVAPLGRHVALTFGPTLSYGKVDALDDGPAALSRSGVSLGVRGGVALVL